MSFLYNFNHFISCVIGQRILNNQTWQGFFCSLYILPNAKLIQLPITNSLEKLVNAHARSVVIKIVLGGQAENTAKVFVKTVGKWNAVGVTVNILKKHVLLDGIFITRH